MSTSVDRLTRCRRYSAWLGLGGGVMLIISVVVAVVAFTPMMGGAGPMLPLAAAVGSFATAVGGLGLLALRGARWVPLVQAGAGAVVVLLGFGEYGISMVSPLLWVIGGVWLAAAAVGIAGASGVQSAVQASASDG